VSRHNMHYWSIDNPHWVRHVDHQVRWSINVWGGIIGEHVLGPHFFEGHLNGQMYLEFLRNECTDLIDQLPLNVVRNMIFQHDGAPAHFHNQVVNFLNQEFPGNWIGRGRGHLIQWPPRSPDLTPLDFFLWGYVKERVFQEIPTTREDMMERIQQAFAAIRRETLRNVGRSFYSRIERCVEVNGRNFEHLI
jgi:hypothetical protein